MKTTQLGNEEILALAEKIDKANNTLATHTELVNLFGTHSSRFTLSVHAARKILRGEAKLSFI